MNTLFNNNDLQKLVDYTNNYIKDVMLEKQFFENLKVWIGISKKDSKMLELRGFFKKFLSQFNIEILECDIQSIISGKVKYDALLFFAVTPGVSARAVELVAVYDALSAAKNNNSKIYIQKEKMYICIPEEYKDGYIERRLSINEKTVSKNYFSKIDLNLLMKTTRTLINISKSKETDMKTRFEPNILIVTALPKEYQAFKDLMQNKPRYDLALGEEKIQFPHYKIGNKDIVLAMSSMGNNFSSAIAIKMLEKYPSIEHIIMVGIAGGIPNIEKPDKHVRLGDIVISGDNGIIQYDMGKKISDGFEYNFSPRPVSALLLRNAQVLIEEKGKGKFEFWENLDSLLEKDEEKYSRKKQDNLNDTPWIEKSSIKLPKAPKGYNNNRPRVHIGAIASSNMVLKDSEARNKLVRDFPDVKAVEMEASGLADASWLHGKDCFVVRGICDYCNPSKHKEWQEYAAAAAAAFAIDLIHTL